MECFEQVIYNHGEFENGIDIILIEKNVFGDLIYTGIILKAEPIKNNTSADATAANIIQQLGLAIAYGYDCTIQNKRVKFNSIRVITSHYVSNKARNTLIEIAKQQNFHTVKFETGEQIVQLIDRYLPKFYFYQSGLHAQVAAALQDKCEKLSDLQNLPQFSVEERALIDVFVKPHLRYVESKRVEGQRKNQLLIRTPDKVIPKNSRILIVGEAGSGKSVILREAVLTALTENTRDRKPSIPLLVKAYDLAQLKGDKFENILTTVVRKYYNLPDFDLSMLQDSKLSESRK
jgi:predicted NACHT family NTPase